MKRQLSEILSAFEYIDRTAYDLAVQHGQGRALSDQDVEGAECFVLVETSGGRREHDEEVKFLVKFSYTFYSRADRNLTTFWNHFLLLTGP